MSTCCLCRKEASRTETRPTGRRFKPQTWHYCEDCFAELERQRQLPDWISLSRYSDFLACILHAPDGREKA